MKTYRKSSPGAPQAVDVALPAGCSLSGGAGAALMQPQALALALSAAPDGFTVTEFTAKVHTMTGQTGTDYTSRQGAYDLRKLRGKDLITKPGRTRRYQIPAHVASTIAALLTLREQVIAPILAGVRSPRLGRKPATWTRVDLWGWRARIGLRRGQTAADVIAKMPALESGLGTRPGAVRVEPDSARADHCLIQVLDTDPHARAIAWPTSTSDAEPPTITAPIPLGLFEDASLVAVTLAHRHGLVGGVAGAGKSGVLNTTSSPR